MPSVFLMIAANAVALHKDHIVGHMFLISYRPNWRWLGMRETAAKSFVDEVEAAWSEYAEEETTPRET